MRKIKNVLRGGSVFKIYDDDIFLVGYPKSGNTWLQFQLACLVAESINDVDYNTIHGFVPDTHHVDNTNLKKLARPRIMKNHGLYTEKFNKVIYIVRDPRDVVVSYYYHHLKLKTFGRDYTLDAYVAEFIKGNGFGSWGEHVEGWLSHRLEKPGFLVVRYEDLKKDNEKSLNSIIRFIGEEAGKYNIQGIIDHCSFSSMKSYEKDQVMSQAKFSKTRQDMQFVRSGKSGGWRDELSEESVDLIVTSFSSTMGKLGYL